MELLEATPIPWAQGVVSSNLAAPTNEINRLQRDSSRTCFSSSRDYHFKSIESSVCEMNCVRTVPKLRSSDARKLVGTVTHRSDLARRSARKRPHAHAELASSPRHCHCG